MTPAELKAWRERMGLSTRWLANRWQVRELTVQRWERNRAMPPDVVADMHHLIEHYHAAAAALAASPSPELAVPRTDAATPDEWPAAWHRAIAVESGKPLAFTPEEAEPTSHA